MSNTQNTVIRPVVLTGKRGRPSLKVVFPTGGKFTVDSMFNQRDAKVAEKPEQALTRMTIVNHIGKALERGEIVAVGLKKHDGKGRPAYQYAKANIAAKKGWEAIQIGG